MTGAIFCSSMESTGSVKAFVAKSISYLKVVTWMVMVGNSL